MWSIETMEILNRITNVNMTVDRQAPLPLFQARDLVQEILRARNLWGNVSVRYALDEIILMLSRQDIRATHRNRLQWAFPPNQGLTLDAISWYLSLCQTPSPGSLPLLALSIWSDRLLWIRRPVTDHKNDDALSIMPVKETAGGAVLAVKGNSWPLQCPKFCLFVLEDSELDEAQLKQLLRKAIETETYTVNDTSSTGSLTLSASDGPILRNWLAAIKPRS